MQDLIESLIRVYCWLLVAASPFLIGLIVGTALILQIDGPLGAIAGGIAVASGIALGIRLAETARRKKQLVEFAHGVPPVPRPENPTDVGENGHERDVGIPLEVDEVRSASPRQSTRGAD